MYPIPDSKWANSTPVFRPKRRKSLPFRVAHTCMAYRGEYLPPPWGGLGILVIVNNLFCFLFHIDRVRRLRKVFKKLKMVCFWFQWRLILRLYNSSTFIVSISFYTCVTAVQFILFNFANYSPIVAMELKVSKEITCKWQYQRSATNMSPEHYFWSCKAEQFSKP